LASKCWPWHAFWIRLSRSWRSCHRNGRIWIWWILGISLGRSGGWAACSETGRNPSTERTASHDSGWVGDCEVWGEVAIEAELVSLF
jgi:hypothetical protein